MKQSQQIFFKKKKENKKKMKQNNFSSSGPILHSSYANYSGFIDKSGKERKQNHQTKINW